MPDRILFVDDEIDILNSFKRQLRKKYDIEIALGAKEALSKIESSPPFAVVISDFNMPEMDGIELLRNVKDVSPNSVRVMLTGQAAVDTAMNAVNEGNIFRFLTKPCSEETLLHTLRASVELNRLITAEQELLERTLSGSISVLSEVLGLVNPIAFSQAQRTKTCVNHMVRKLGIPRAWQFELASLLSTIGCVTIPQETLNKVDQGLELSDDEQRIVDNHPQVARDLLVKIPRMSVVAGMIAAQNVTFERRNESSDYTGENFVALGGNLIRIATVFDRFTLLGESRRATLKRLSMQPDKYYVEAVHALSDYVIRHESVIEKSVKVSDLYSGMVLNENVMSSTGILIAVKGQDVSQTMIHRLEAFSFSIGIREPFKVLVRAVPSA